MSSVITFSAERKAKRRRNITKADISTPSEFRHVSHVGWDPDKGFDINCDDPQLNEFFQKAGVSEKQLQDKDTLEFIYDFIDKNGGLEAVQEDVKQTSARKPAPTPPSPVAGPPVPPRGAMRAPHSRTAPPPPPSGIQPPKPTMSREIYAKNGPTGTLNKSKIIVGKFCFFSKFDTSSAGFSGSTTAASSSSPSSNPPTTNSYAGSISSRSSGHEIGAHGKYPWRNNTKGTRLPLPVS